jgi:hypothetical protein
MKTKVILTALALIASVGFISAQNTKAETSKAETKKSCYVDANKNGVCDKHEDKSCTKGNGKGLQDGSGQGNGKGVHKGNGCCGANHNNQGLKPENGKGPNYVDANNNGICDHREVIKK